MRQQKLWLVTIGERVTQLRGKVSQRELARLSGVDVGTISRIERGKIDPSFSTLQALARGLRIDVALLVDLDDGIPQRAATQPSGSLSEMEARIAGLEDRQARSIETVAAMFRDHQELFLLLARLLEARGVLTPLEIEQLLRHSKSGG